MRFSLIYPTRHRPKFIEMALKFLERQGYDDFEVIVSDNYIDPSMSCEAYCRNSSLRKIKYVRPEMPLSMVGNWNFALQHASGDYLCYFTDKMFLLPGTLAYSEKILQKSPVEILNWVDSKFSPFTYPDYFGGGLYVKGTPGVSSNRPYEEFDPKEELRKKAFAAVSRSQQSPSHYARGKLCFGAYHRDLVRRILNRTETLFYNISPDYTSMILGLSYASSALEINRPGIVHINTDLSNGGQGSVRDEHAYLFLTSLDGGGQIFDEMLIPNLYSCTHNVVAHDYISLQRRFNLDYELKRVNWLVYTAEDLDSPQRIWSTPQIEHEQRRLFEDFIENNLEDAERQEFYSKLRQRTSEVGKSKGLRMIKSIVKPFVPKFFLEMRKKIRVSDECRLAELRDLLQFQEY